MHSDAVERRLGSLQQLAKQGKQVNGLFRLLGSPTVWDWAYEAVAPNKGALTPGVDRTNTLDGYSLARRDGLIKRVRDGSYRFAPTRRQYIPKADGRKRPLGIPTADDKLVQAAVKTVLENIYEPVFAETSHGFRKGRSCHTALENIERTWTGVKWLVEVDISDFFGNIDHDVLLNLLKKRIDDADFLKLVQRMLTAGCMDQGTFIPTFSGTPQGGVISPLLANVVLHELDEFMAGMKGAFDKGERRQPHAEYQRLTIEIRKKRLQINTRQRNGKLDEVPGLLRQIKELEKQRSAYPSQDEMDPGYKRMHYCRYADDFLVGVIGSKADADKVMSDIRSFLADVLKLPVSEAKSGVCKASEGAKFLGYTVRTANSKRLVRRKSAGRTVTTRSPVGRLQLHLPVEKLAKYVETKRLGNYGAVRGDMRPELINSPDADIVVTYNAMLRGLAEYYKLGTQWKTQLNPVAKVWWFSLMKTLSRKHKCSIRATYARMNRKGKVGVELETKKGTRFIEVFKLSQVKSRPEREWGVDCVPNADILAMAGRNTLVDRLKAKACDACGNTGTTITGSLTFATDKGNVTVPVEYYEEPAPTVTSRLDGKPFQVAQSQPHGEECSPTSISVPAGTLVIEDNFGGCGNGTDVPGFDARPGQGNDEISSEPGTILTVVSASSSSNGGAPVAAVTECSANTCSIGLRGLQPGTTVITYVLRVDGGQPYTYTFTRNTVQEDVLY